MPVPEARSRICACDSSIRGRDCTCWKARDTRHCCNAVPGQRASTAWWIGGARVEEVLRRLLTSDSSEPRVSPRLFDSHRCFTENDGHEPERGCEMNDRFLLRSVAIENF